MQVQIQNLIFDSGAWVLGGGAPPAPPAPTAFNLNNGTANGDEQLIWAESGSPDHIQIWRSINGAPAVLIVTIAGGVLAYVDTLAAANSLIEYKIRAEKAGVFSSFTVLRGALFSKDDSAVVGPVVYPTVQVISGTYDADTSAITSASFPELLYAMSDTGKINFNSAPDITLLSAPKLQEAGSIDLATAGAPMSISFPLLGQIDGFFSLAGTVISTYDFSSLASVGDFLDLSSSPYTGTFSFPDLASVSNDLAMNNSNSPTGLSAPNLTDVGGNLSIQNCAGLVTLNLPQLQNQGTVAGDLVVSNCPALTTLNIGPVNSVQNFTLSSLGALTSFTCGVLFTGGLFSVQGLGIASLSFPGLTALNNDMNISSNSCTTLSLPVLSFVSGNVTMNNTSLANLIIPTSGWMGASGGTFDFSGCALTHTSVERILAAGVSSGLFGATVDVSGGTNAGFASLSAQGQADYTTLTNNGNVVNINP